MGHFTARCCLFAFESIAACVTDNVVDVDVDVDVDVVVGVGDVYVWSVYMIQHKRKTTMMIVKSKVNKTNLQKYKYSGSWLKYEYK